MKGDCAKLTRILGILWTNIFITGIQDVFVHQGSPWRNLSEEAHFNGLPILDPLALLNKYLPSILATIFAVQAWHTVLFRMMTFLERLQRCHKIVASRNSGSYHPFGNAGCDSTFDNSGDRVHRPYHFGLILRRDVQFNLLEKVFRGTKAANNEDVLIDLIRICLPNPQVEGVYT